MGRVAPVKVLVRVTAKGVPEKASVPVTVNLAPVKASVPAKAKAVPHWASDRPVTETVVRRKASVPRVKGKTAPSLRPGSGGG